ncbi:MAG: RNA polymerase sigma factor [Bacteroidia bacterium]|jgi:RNA polymerase sigma-70 factor (ECF subfamily)|nr:RNA polymerase sigma factor [Bacteroidia bacterium]GIV23478.1 MAG: DNA-directed RNA polymerase sigma-70 factor [Bacteroidia bacterium]
MDASLWERLQAEETRLAAFEELVRTFYPQVKRWVRQWVQDPALAEDITQETFLRAWEKCHTFRGEAAFSTWLYTIARRETLRFLKKQNRFAFIPWPWTNEEGPEEPAAEPIPHYTRFYTELEKTLAELPPMQRAVFEAAWENHLPYKEVAQKLGIRENTVKAHLYHIRQKLWKRLRSWLADE